MNQTELQQSANFRENEILTREMLDRITALETTVKQLSVTGSSAVDIASVKNLLFNSDLTDSYNTRFEAVAGSGNSSKEVAYFFTHVSSATALSNKTALTHPADTVTPSIKENTHTNWASNIQNPRWDKANGVILIGKTNTIDVPLGDFNAAGTSFLGGHPLRPGSPMFVTFLLARKSQYIYSPGRVYVGIWNNKSGSEGWLNGSNYALTGIKGGPETPAATVSAQYMIAIETDQGYTLVSDVVTIANSPALVNFTPNAYNYLSWAYIAGTNRVRVYRKLGAGNVFELSDYPQGNSYQDKGTATATDTGIGTFPTFIGQKTKIETYWASSETLLQSLAIDGVTATWELFRVTLGIANTVDFGNVENPYLRIGFTEPAGIRVTDVVTNATTAVTSAAAQFTAGMTGKAFTLTDPATGNVHTGTLTYVSSTSATLSAACPWTSNDNILIVDDCIEDAFVIDKLGLDFNAGNWSPRSEDTAQRVQTTASAPAGSSQGSGSITTGGSGGSDPVFGGGIGKTDCVLDTTMIYIIGQDGEPTQIEAQNVMPFHKVWYGERDADGKPIYNEVISVDHKPVKQIIHFTSTNDRELYCTEAHRLVKHVHDKRDGNPASTVFNKTWVMVLNVQLIFAEIRTRKVLTGDFNVCSFVLKVGNGSEEKGHLMLCNGFLSHNNKEIVYE